MPIYSRPDLFAVKTHETFSVWDFQESLSIQNQSWNSSLVITTEKKMFTGSNSNEEHVFEFKIIIYFIC